MISRMRRRLAAAAAIVAISMSGGAMAAHVTYYFAATLTVTDPDRAGFAGTVLTGSLTYDPAASPLEPPTPSSRRSALAPGAVTAFLGPDQIASTDARLVQFWNIGIMTALASGTGDWLIFGDRATASGAHAPFNILQLSLFDANDDAGLGASPGLPPSVLDLAKFEHAGLMLGFIDPVDPFRELDFAGGSLSCLSTVRADCIVTATVSEPSSLALLPLVFAAVGWSCRRRHR